MDFYADRYGIMEPGRFMAIQIPVPKLVGLLKKTEEGDGYRIVENGIPGDARIVRTSLEWIGPVQILYIVAESEEWPLLSEIDPIPLLSPSVRSTPKRGEKGGKRPKKQGRGVVEEPDRPPFGPGSDEDPSTFPPVEEDEPELPI